MKDFFDGLLGCLIGVPIFLPIAVVFIAIAIFVIATLGFLVTKYCMWLWGLI